MKTNMKTILMIFRRYPNMEMSEAKGRFPMFPLFTFKIRKKMKLDLS